MALDDEETRRRGFDFSEDYVLLNELAQTIFERAKQERGDARRQRRVGFLEEAKGLFQRVLELDPENATAHYNLDLIYKQLGDKEKAKVHFALHRKYKPDDNARDKAVVIARKNDPAADHAAEAIVIYDLGRDGAFELEQGAERRVAAYELRPPASGEALAGEDEAKLAVPVPSAGY